MECAVQGVRFQAAVLVLVLWALGFGALLAVTLAQTGGMLIYTPVSYTHLTLPTNREV